VVIEEKAISNIAQSLLGKGHVFDFANHFRNKKDSILSVDQFSIDTSIYTEFKDFLEGKDYAYKTETEKLLFELEEVTKKEKYFDDVKEAYKTLEDKIFLSKEADLTTFSEEIKEFLENEVVARYYYQKGRVQSSLKYDEEIKKALEYASNTEEYFKMLSNDTASIKN
jgi:carboxyl-terminal processing protease